MTGHFAFQVVKPGVPLPRPLRRRKLEMPSRWLRFQRRLA